MKSYGIERDSTTMVTLRKDKIKRPQWLQVKQNFPPHYFFSKNSCKEIQYQIEFRNIQLDKI